ncbi:substrate of the Dot/Icm secretion system [Legionella moravica]|uniref:Dot/Icm secretion system substrate n=1 Tax=Legionella moravica TaxID=39962 RepID=A0A378K2T6_9GAMM|nr:DUF456 domain-containing protein [Legionella moravica]KTD34741.1 substrate of the Dot/Icm secretion system [Legionella moravica]STX64002.1 Dot/Icm secretion system substrate [Legionella moravica]
MALSEKIKLESYNTLVHLYQSRLNETDKEILNHINNYAADNDIPLHLQGKAITDYLVNQIKLAKSEHNEDLPGTANLIYGLVLEHMDSLSKSNRSRHSNQGRFDLSGLHTRSPRDQMQDHDMTLLMPKSTGNISVMAVLNRFDHSSALAIQDVLASELFNEVIQHVIIPIGPGHWRGAYLTKPSKDGVIYDLELFDPYGRSGGSAIKDYTLNLLEQCGINRELIRINYSGPAHPQGDAYSCGDFTCAYSHKKMQELGAPKGSYNNNLIATLDNLGNQYDALRMATRAEIQLILEGRRVNPSPVESVGSSDETIKNPEQPESPIVPILPHLRDDAVKPEMDQGTHTAKIKPAIKSSSDGITTEITNLSSGARIGIEAGSVAGATGIGALIGGLIGFFALPIVGALVGSLVGAGIGLLLSTAAAGLGRLLWSNDAGNHQKSSLKSDNNEAAASKSNSCAMRDLPKQELAADQEPIISPPLFQPSSPQTPRDADNTVENSPNGPK